MTVETVYADVVDQSGSWNNISNALGAPDNSCADTNLGSDIATFEFGTISESASNIDSINSTITAGVKFQFDNDFGISNPFEIWLNDPDATSVGAANMCAGHDDWTSSNANGDPTPACVDTTWHDVTCSHFTYQITDWTSGSTASTGIQFRASVCVIDSLRAQIEYTLKAPSPTSNASAIEDAGLSAVVSQPTYDFKATEWQVQQATDSIFTANVSSSSWMSISNDDQNISVPFSDTWYFRVRFRNADQTGSFSGYDSVFIQDVPDSQNLDSITAGDSFITVTRNSTYPDGHGEPVDSWELWRSPSTNSDIEANYSLVQDGLTSTSYTDWKVDGGETWFYRAKFTNLYGDSAISPSSLNTTATTPELSTTSDSTINIINDITKLSDSLITDSFDIKEAANTVIFVPDQETSIFSNSTVQIINDITKLSDTLITDTFELTSLSDSRILVPDNELTKLSDSAIYQSEWGNILVTSDTNITDTFNITTTSDTLLVVVREEIIRGNTRIHRTEFDVKQIPSDSAIFISGYDTKELVSDSSILERQELMATVESSIKEINKNTLNSISSVFQEAWDMKEVSSDSRIVSEGITILSKEVNSRVLSNLSKDLTSDSFIILTFLNDLSTDSTVFSPAFGNITLDSDTRIHDTMDILTSSDARLIDTLKDTLPSDTSVKWIAALYPHMNIEISTDSRIHTTKKDTVTSAATINDIFEMTQLSDTLILHKPILDKLSDSVIKKIGQDIIFESIANIAKTIEIPMDSNARIFDLDQKQILSDTKVKLEIDIELNTSSAVFKGMEFTMKGDTLVINLNENLVPSNASVFNPAFGLLQKPAVTFVSKSFKFTKPSDTRNKVIDKHLFKSSQTRVKREMGDIVVEFNKKRQT